MIDKNIINYVPKEYRFGTWGGNPKGREEDITRCFYEVYDHFTHGFHQCYRRRGYGYKGLFCKQHAKFYKHLEET
jgi:hypothetical protein